MQFTTKQIADFLQGRVDGDETIILNDFGKIEEATEGKLTFLSNPKYTHYIYTTKASAVLVNEDFVAEQATPTLIRVKNAYEALAQLLQLADSMKPKKQGIHPTAQIDPTAKIGDLVYIGAYAVVSANAEICDGAKIYPHVFIDDNVRIGEETILYANTVVYPDCQIGNRCIVHSGAVIGSDGFGFAPDAEGRYNKIPQLGNVIIEDDVEIGANTVVDRATMGSTVVRQGCKIDNLSDIAHNVVVGEHTAMAAQTGIAGSTKIGAHCVFGGQCGAVGHITIADGCRFGAKTGIAGTIKKQGTYAGYPEQEIHGFRRSFVALKNLPDIWDRLSEVEKTLKTKQ